MSVPSIDTLSTTIDDDISIVINESSDTTVATQTSTSWHSIISDEQLNQNLFIRSHSINIWLKKCAIEPDIRLTTAQEWKLRTCIRRLLSLSNLPLKISCIKINDSISFIDQEKQSLTMNNLTLISHACRPDKKILYDQLHYLGLYLRTLSLTNITDDLLEIKLFEFYSIKSDNHISIHIPLIKLPKYIYYISTNCLQLNLRSINSLLQLQFTTRDNELIQGYYYKWNDIDNESHKFKATVDIDQNLIRQFNSI